MSSVDRIAAKRLERRVVFGAAGVALALIGIVLAAHLSGGAQSDEHVVASAVSASDPGGSQRSPFSSIFPIEPGVSPLHHAGRPALIQQASGDPAVVRGFGGLRVGTGLSYANLTIFPVDRPGASSGNPKDDIGTLDEGMSNQVVSVVEPALTVTNGGNQPTFVPGGQVMPGGGQDQGVAADAVISPHAANISLASFCVEPGRSFGPSPDYASGGAMAIPAVRYPMQVLGDQEAVWDAVGNATSHFDARTSTGAYEALVKSRSAMAAVAPYADSLQENIAGQSGGRTVGAVVALNGHVICADVFASPALFERMWPALLRSYALQAAICPAKAPAGVTQSAASAWLASLDNAPGAQKDGAAGTESANVSVLEGAGIRTAIPTGGHSALVHEAFWSPDGLQQIGS
jgi:hypothetical protein